MGSCQSSQSRDKTHPKKHQNHHEVAEHKSDRKSRSSTKIMEEDELKKEIYDLFTIFDTDKDGKLSQEQVQVFLKQLDKGKKFVNKDYKAVAKELILKLDKNQDHGIQNWELYNYYKNY